MLEDKYAYHLTSRASHDVMPCQMSSRHITPRHVMSRHVTPQLLPSTIGPSNVLAAIEHLRAIREMVEVPRMLEVARVALLKEGQRPARSAGPGL